MESHLARIQAARKKYRPSVVKVILVAEAPPVFESRRFFYFEDVPERDTLFWEIIKVLYPDVSWKLKVPRARKTELLLRFQRDGFYLVDAVDLPLGKVSSIVKRRRICDSLPNLRQVLLELVDSSTNIILISASVFDVCAIPLKSGGFNVVNTEMIDFPGSGCQPRFREKFAKALRLLRKQ